MSYMYAASNNTLQLIFCLIVKLYGLTATMESPSLSPVVKKYNLQQ